MTDMDMDITSSSDTNQNLTETAERKRVNEKSDFANLNYIQYNNSDDENDEQIEIESGVDALEDAELVMPKENPPSPEVDDSFHDQTVQIRPAVILPPIKCETPKKYVFTTKLIFLSAVALSSFVIFPSFILLNGFLIGIWFSHFIHELYLKFWNVLGNNGSPKKTLVYPDYQNISVSRVSHIVEFEPLKKYQGWINVYILDKYDPLTYHISMTQTASMKLEGCVLRLSFTHNKIPKRALWDEKPHKVPFYQHRIYNLEGAKIKLLPVGIVRKRHWSKKYPICLILKDASKLTVYNAKSHSIDDNGHSVEVPQLPLFSKNDSSEKLSKLELSLSEPKDIRNEQDSKFKGSPRKRTISIDEKLSKSLPTDSSETLTEENKKSSQTKSPSKPFLIKAIKEQLRPKNSDTPPASPENSLKITSECSDPPIIKERPGSSNSLHSNLSDAGLLDDFKEVSQYLEDENEIDIQSEYEKNILSDEWSKDDNNDNEEEQVILYLFGRTGREKDEWFRRLKTAIDDATVVQDVDSNDNGTTQQEEDQLDVTKNLEPFDNLHEEIKQVLQKDNAESKVKLGNIKTPKKSAFSTESQSVLWTSGDNVKESPLINTFFPKREESFWRYMKDIIENKKTPDITADQKTQYDVMWLNAIIGRIIFDTFKNDAWVTMVQERIQKKLKSLKLPPFMSPLLITAMEFGPETPQIRSVSAPQLDARGVWVDLHVTYDGRVTMTLTTQLNLMYLKEKKDIQSEESILLKECAKIDDKDNLLAVYDSDLDDTAESSSEDETPLTQLPPTKSATEADSPVPPASTGSSAKKILRIVDKIAASKYFQHVTEYKYVKRALEEVSNTDLKLSVELYGLVGCLTINIPPPPSDRVWIGFRENPQILLKAKPEVGSRVINFAHITSWIEKKLCREFEKVLVMPNMEDFQLDFMIAPVID
ncbi:testis-expressed protein 2 isoform X2 [Arctopsyche grandis]